MEIKNLFDEAAYRDIVQRIEQLTPANERVWGKMNISQMLAHCARIFGIPNSDKPVPRMFIGRLLGPMMRPLLYNEKPWKQGLPTAPYLKVVDQREFEKEKAALLERIRQFYELGPGKAGRFPHPFFGKMTPEQWGKSMWKHVDHHLRQFKG
jgi:hypothetical protein